MFRTSSFRRLPFDKTKFCSTGPISKIRIERVSIVDNENPHEHDPHKDSEADKKASTRKLRKFPRRRLTYLVAACGVLLTAGLTIGGAYIASMIPQTPSVEDLLDARSAEPSLLFSADGTQLAVYSQGQQHRVNLSQVSPYVVKALVATEDHRFYDHRGVDLGRTMAAIFHTAGGVAQGGSTITQQLVRNLFPEEIGRSRTVERKLREIITAIKIERAYTKEQILETYLNSVPFLYNVIGIEMAARTYYDKSASSLDVLESATLVGMLKGTSYYNPVLNPDRAQKRRNVVLGQMRKRGMLSQAEFDGLRDKPLQVQLNRQPDPLAGPAPHFAAHLRKWLVQWADEHDYNLYTDGLIIHSTIDDRLQEAAARAVERQAEVLQTIADVEWGQKSSRVASYTPAAYATLRKRVEPFRQFWDERPELLDAFIRETPNYKKAVAAGRTDAQALAALKANSKFIAQLRANKTRLEAGFVAMDPATGEVKAWVGSRNFERDQFDHVAQAERQPGSTFKPIVYGAALEQGMRPEHAYQDGPVEIRSDDGSVWRPTDMTGSTGQLMSMREGLILSKNTITAQVMQDIGLPSVIKLAKAVGVNQSKLDPVPSLSLGTSPVTLLEMASAYSTIARLGEYRQPVMIRRITDRAGKVLAEFNVEKQREKQRAMSEDTAVELIDMMRGVVKRGTGQTVKTQFGIVADIAGKTGTTQNNTDGWFMLMHPNLVAGAWVGFNDSRVAMRSDYWGQGGHNAVLVVGDFFKDTLKSKLINVKAQFPKPKRPPPLMVQADDWLKQLDAARQPLPAGHGVVSSRGGDAYVVGPDGVRKLERQQTAGAAAGLNGTETASGGSGNRGASMSGGGRGAGALAHDRPRVQADPYEAIWGTVP
jgi:penicillin-binding protein 1A